MDDKVSGFKSQLYERKKADGTMEYVYAFAGTDGFSKADWKNNYEQVLGESSQYKIAMHNAAEIRKKLSKEQELTFVGHSLGGGLAAASAYETAGRAITFNAAGVSELTTHKSTLANIDAYITVGDELNAFQVFMPFMNVADGKKHWRYGRLLFGHSIENFISPPLIISNKK